MTFQSGSARLTRVEAPFASYMTADGVGTDGQMRAMLLDHSHRQDEQCPLTIEGINLGPGELLELVDSRAGGGAIALRRWLTSGRLRRRHNDANDQHDERLLHKSLPRRWAVDAPHVSVCAELRQSTDATTVRCRLPYRKRGALKIIDDGAKVSRVETSATVGAQPARTAECGAPLPRRLRPRVSAHKARCAGETPEITAP